MKSLAAGARRVLVAGVFAVCGLMAMPSRALAQVEVTGVFGGLLGGDLDNILAGNVSVKGAFDNGPLYGVRVGGVGGFFGVEGSFVRSPTGVSVTAPGGRAGLDASVSYLEGNVLFIPIPGPISPFVTAGAGLHSYDIEYEALGVTLQDDFQKFGWNWGGGLKINIKGLTLRADVRDHITKVGPADFGLEDLAEALGLRDEQTLHNVEISGGVGIRF